MMSQAKLTVLGPDAVLLTYRLKDSLGQTRRSSVWRRDQDGALRLFFHQGTRTGEHGGLFFTP